MKRSLLPAILALIVAVGVAAPAPALADHDEWREHQEHEHEWHEHEWHEREWRERHWHDENRPYYVAPPVVVSPPPAVYYAPPVMVSPPPMAPGISVILPIRIR